MKNNPLAALLLLGASLLLLGTLNVPEYDAGYGSGCPWPSPHAAADGGVAGPNRLYPCIWTTEDTLPRFLNLSETRDNQYQDAQFQWTFAFHYNGLDGLTHASVIMTGTSSNGTAYAEQVDLIEDGYTYDTWDYCEGQYPSQSTNCGAPIYRLFRSVTPNRNTIIAIGLGSTTEANLMEAEEYVAGEIALAEPTLNHELFMLLGLGDSVGTALELHMAENSSRVYVQQASRWDMLHIDQSQYSYDCFPYEPTPGNMW